MEVNGKRIPKQVNMVETLVDIDPTDISDSEGPWDYDSKRVLEVKSLRKGEQDEDTFFNVIPTENADFKMKVKWTTDSGVQNTVPLLGCCSVKLTNERGKAIKTTVYVTEHKTESLLGKEDAIKLGIMKINPKGEAEDSQEEKARHVIDNEGELHLRCITTRVQPELGLGTWFKPWIRHHFLRHLSD